MSELPKVNPLWKRWALASIVPVIIAVATYFTTGKVVVPDVPPIPNVPIFGQGWVRDDDEVEAVRATLKFPDFSDTPASLAMGAEPKEVFLWNAARKVVGNPLPARNQLSVGACVGLGTASAVEHTLLAQIASWDKANGPPPTFREISPEIIYAGSRVQIGGGRIRGDGSVGAWAARFVNEYGILGRGKYGKLDLSAYSESICRQLGAGGVPADLIAEVKLRPVKDISQIKSVADARKSLANGYAIAVCSNVGFVNLRDSQGFCKPAGNWQHCMSIIGYRSDRPGFYIMNSWGADYFRGPLGAGDPPDGGFWADESVVAGMLSQGDSWAFADATGFPPRPVDKLDWASWVQVPKNKGIPTVFASK